MEKLIMFAMFIGMQETDIGWYDSEEVLNNVGSDNTFDSLHFDTDWNWLMSVVDYIENIDEGIYQVNILQEGCFIQKRCSTIIVDKRVGRVPDGTTKRESTYQAVLEFIELFNENNL